VTRTSRWTLVILVVVLLAAGGTWLWSASRSPAAPTPSSPAPAPSPTPPVPALEVTLRRVKAVPVRGEVKARKLRAPAEAVRQTFTELYTTAFVDPNGWAGGAFPGIFDHFAPAAREEARRHLDDLTLGRAAEHVSAVRPEWARLDVRFLVGPARVPVAAQVSMRFAATAVAGDGTEVPVRHRGEYVLERLEGRWLVMAYEVDGGFGPEALP
jgi:hypothetical protein